MRFLRFSFSRHGAETTKIQKKLFEAVARCEKGFYTEIFLGASSVPVSVSNKMMNNYISRNF